MPQVNKLAKELGHFRAINMTCITKYTAETATLQHNGFIGNYENTFRVYNAFIYREKESLCSKYDEFDKGFHLDLTGYTIRVNINMSKLLYSDLKTWPRMRS